MATTAARRRWWPAVVLTAACIRSDVALPIPASAPQVAPSRAPGLRIGLQVGASRVAVGGGAALVVSDNAGAVVARIAAGTSATVTPVPGQVEFRAPGPGGRASGSRLVVRGDGGAVRVAGRDYRGDLVLLRDKKGVTIINRVGAEEYLLGVVVAELGVKDPGDLEALKAQAIVSRTYALRNLGRWEADGFDLYAGVGDQVYAGMNSESPLGRQAVDATRGQVVTWQGQLIDAFFSSTCAGRTTRGTDVFRAADRPYLRSIVDAPASGPAWCSISPRYAWKETWTGDALRATLRKTLASAAPVSAAEVDGVRDVRVTARNPDGRVASLAVVLRRRQVAVEGPMVRQVLRPSGADLLRSTMFRVSTTERAGRVAGMVIDGNGSGHGVGMCQWGAIGRARAGQSAPEILAAYYAGTAIVRHY